MRVRTSVLPAIIAAVVGCGAEPEATEVTGTTQALSLRSLLQWASPDWAMSTHDGSGHGNNRSEFRLRSRNVDQLEVKWVFDSESYGADLGPIHGTPIVTRDAVYFGTNAGRFLALHLDGTLKWDYTTRPPNPLLEQIARPAPVGGTLPDFVGTPVTGGAVFAAEHGIVSFGDLDGNIYGLDAETGEELWVAERVDAHPLGGVFGNSLLYADGKVVVGFAAIEDFALGLPDFGIPYTCCSHTGFVAALDVRSGEMLWRYDTIPPTAVSELGPEFAPFGLGPAGADVWGQPTYDTITETIYFGTGQNYSPSADGSHMDTSDALVALDARTGEEKWVTQITAGDIWVRGIQTPTADGRFLDQDFGDSLKIYRLADGRKVVGAAQKSGDYVVADAHTGEVLHNTSIVQQANQLGGLQTGSAYGRGSVFVHGQDGLDPTTDRGPFFGRVLALSPDGTEVRWQFERFYSVFAAPVTLARDVLYFLSPVEEPTFGEDPFEFALYALDADTGEVRLRRTFPGRAVSQPVVSRGRVYIATGNSAIAELGEVYAGSIIALGR